jgi:hypothetical protein
MSAIASGITLLTPRLSAPRDFRTLRVSVLLLAVAILNAVDLAFTLFADRISLLNEINPIAAAFLQAGLTPSLVCFKILMVTCGLGMIWRLRHSRLAIPACWILFLAYAGLAVIWYIWVRDVTFGGELRFSQLAPP